ncbi:MAG: class I SAM-dependent methyltransferase [Planctomycetota bacterium]|nr:MAG: class I SAM-dependent methyltransferase [Planctomycetota bacterium]REJ93393.1 MAG: class I SAM-dependent methyltransferase [Planctomycetota bacterium]REK20770.1 MAG: class I SAM-dependent methyltransferase [Planctomycetota bacterium]REK38048.1 MAG: class I SAM-dependent methyltransferase [Planctomycetota bacterium]
MRWWMVAGILSTLARLPGGKRAYALLQQRYGELARLEASSRFDNAEWIVSQARQWCGELGDLRCVELGTGWVPAVPLALLSAGARVDTYDVSLLCKPWLFQRTHEELTRRTDAIAVAAGVDRSSIAERLARIRNSPDLAAACHRLGGRYRAPFDTSRLPYKDGEADLLVSNLVLQCVPPEILPPLLSETYRVLRPGGFAIHRMRLSDEFAVRDPQRNHLEFLRYSRTRWNLWFNSSLKHQNRLRASQFELLFTEAGFRVRNCDRTVDEESLPVVENLALAEEFRDLDPRDLATINLDVVLQKPSRQPASSGAYRMPAQDAAHDV